MQANKLHRQLQARSEIITSLTHRCVFITQPTSTHPSLLAAKTRSWWSADAGSTTMTLVLSRLLRLLPS
jgi:hypothetical protein